jgi:hypothetical protein
MHYPNRRDFIRLLTTSSVARVARSERTSGKAEALGNSLNRASEDQALDPALDIVSQHKIVYTTPPSHIPKSVSIDAPFLGNYDLLTAFAGDPQHPQFWVTTNDFWELRDVLQSSKSVVCARRPW